MTSICNLKILILLFSQNMSVLVYVSYAPSITRSMGFALKQSGDVTQFLTDNFVVEAHAKALFSLFLWLITINVVSIF